MKTRPYGILLMLVAAAAGCGTNDASRSRPVQQEEVEIISAAGLLMEIVQETSDPNAKWRAVRALGYLRYEKAVPLFIHCLYDDNHYVRANAASALGDMRVATASYSLLELLKVETDGGVIEQVSLALRHLGVREAVSSLKKVADHPSGQTRVWVLQAIGELGDRRDVPFVAKRLEAEFPCECEMAARAIEALAGVDFGFPQTQGLYDPEPLIGRARLWWAMNRTKFVGEI